MLNSILERDAALFRFLNGHAVSPLWDGVMIFVSGIWPWLIGALCGLGILVWKRRWTWWRPGLIMLTSIGLSDAISAFILKPYFERMRPCRMIEDANVLMGCAGLYGFPSNHAANAAATAVSLILIGGCRPWTMTILGLALAVAYSRIYVGAHYPLDVSAGFLLGTLVAVLVHHLNKQWIKLRQEKTFSS